MSDSISFPPASSRPWLNWPKELPKSKDFRPEITPHFNLIHDENKHRLLNQQIRATTLERARKELNGKDSAILLQGGTSQDFELYDTDVDKCEFRQESFFRYLFGINEPDCYGLINLNSGESVLFVPFVNDDAERWTGTRRSLSYYQERYGVTQALHTNQINEYLNKNNIKKLFLLNGVNTDSGNATRTQAKFEGIEKYECDSSRSLYTLLEEQRVIKTQHEIDLLRLGNFISSQAHVYVMRHIKEGMCELQLEMLFKAWAGYFGGARHMAYTCICGSGANGSVLHYGHAGRPNDRFLTNKDSVVLDMGAEYIGYATDITRSYVVNGKFSADQAAIHNAVAEAQQAVINQMKPGYDWRDAHRLSERVILKHLNEIGIIHGGSLEEYEAAFLGAVFMPHGLGHLLGLNVHDVGGYQHGNHRSHEPGLCWLRCGRKLEAGMVITVEPGIYFNDPTLNKALKNPAQAKFINETVLNRFRGTGGCRLEDDVLVTPTGAENLTILPTTVQEIEQVMADN